jgi:hypothetical protein
MAQEAFIEKARQPSALLAELNGLEEATGSPSRSWTEQISSQRMQVLSSSWSTY